MLVMREINSSSVGGEEATLNRPVRKGMRREKKAFQAKKKKKSLCKGPEAQLKYWAYQGMRP